MKEKDYRRVMAMKDSLYFPDLRNKTFTIRHTLVSFPGHLFFVGSTPLHRIYSAHSKLHRQDRKKECENYIDNEINDEDGVFGKINKMKENHKNKKKISITEWKYKTERTE